MISFARRRKVENKTMHLLLRLLATINSVQTQEKVIFCSTGFFLNSASSTRKQATSRESCSACMEFRTSFARRRKLNQLPESTFTSSGDYKTRAKHRQKRTFAQNSTLNKLLVNKLSVLQTIKLPNGEQPISIPFYSFSSSKSNSKKALFLLLPLH